MKKTKIVIGVLVLILMFSTFVNAKEITNVKVSLGGEPLNIPSEYGYPFIDKQNRTMIPLRIISERLGHKVEWDQRTKTATIDNEVQINIGSTTVFVPGSKENPTGSIEMDTKAIIKGTRTYVPLRFVIEALGYEVTYNGPKSSNGHNHMVDIFKEGMNIVPDTGEGYKIKTPSGTITLNPETDIKSGSKNLKDEKAKELINALYDSMEYVENEDYATLDFYQPELPKDFEWVINVEAVSQSSEYRMFYSSSMDADLVDYSIQPPSPNVKLKYDDRKISEIEKIIVMSKIVYKGNISNTMVTELKTGRRAFGDEYLFEDYEIDRVEDFYLPQYRK